MIRIVLLNALLAAMFIFLKFTVHQTQPFFNMGLRMVCVGLLILLVRYWRQPGSVRWDRSHFFLYCSATLFTLFIPFSLRSWGLLYMTPAKAAFLCNFGPFIAYLMACFLALERMTFFKISGLMISFLGTLPIILPPLLESSSGFALLPDLAMVISVASASYGWLVIHKMIRHHAYHPMFLSGLTMLGTGLLALTSSCLVEDMSKYHQDFVPGMLLLSVVIASCALSYNLLYTSLLKIYSPSLLAFGGFLTPFFAGLYGWIAFGHAITPLFFVANSIVFAGMLLFYAEGNALFCYPSIHARYARALRTSGENFIAWIRKLSVP
jgi:drug/metabolite transporter (DMT)-like permease